MKKEDAQEVISCLPKGRTKFHYFKDRYCFELLDYEIKARGGVLSLNELRSSRFAKFLTKPSVKSRLAVLNHKQIKCGDRSYTVSSGLC